jgi:hypothetical protein
MSYGQTDYVFFPTVVCEKSIIAMVIVIVADFLAFVLMHTKYSDMLLLSHLTGRQN